MKEGTGWRCFLYFKNTVWVGVCKGPVSQGRFWNEEYKDKVAATKMWHRILFSINRGVML